VLENLWIVLVLLLESSNRWKQFVNVQPNAHYDRQPLFHLKLVNFIRYQLGLLRLQLAQRPKLRENNSDDDDPRDNGKDSPLDGAELGEKGDRCSPESFKFGVVESEEAKSIPKHQIILVQLHLHRFFRCLL